MTPVTEPPLVSDLNSMAAVIQQDIVLILLFENLLHHNMTQSDHTDSPCSSWNTPWFSSSTCRSKWEQSLSMTRSFSTSSSRPKILRGRSRTRPTLASTVHGAKSIATGSTTYTWEKTGSQRHERALEWELGMIGKQANLSSKPAMYVQNNSITVSQNCVFKTFK